MSERRRFGRRARVVDEKVVTFGPTVSDPPMEPPYRVILERVIALEARVATLEEREQTRG